MQKRREPERRLLELAIGERCAAAGINQKNLVFIFEKDISQDSNICRGSVNHICGARKREPFSMMRTPSTSTVGLRITMSRWKAVLFLPPIVALEPNPKCTVPRHHSSSSMSPQRRAFGLSPIPNSASTVLFLSGTASSSVLTSLSIHREYCRQQRARLCSEFPPAQYWSRCPAANRASPARGKIPEPNWQLDP